MFTVNRRKGQKGFTLVEVIVVAVIVAALAAVAIPLYLSYVDSSRKNAAANAAGSIASFCGACVNSGATLTPASGVVADSVHCSNNTGIQIPKDIAVQIKTSPRSISAIHTSSDSSVATNKVSYNF